MIRTLARQASSVRNHQLFIYRELITNQSSEWKSTIGLEVHAQISVESKLFSSGSSSYGLPTNNCVNLFDAAIPGTLPVLNYKAVELATATSLALQCSINPVSYFDRKHYFYSDLPNGYQITQQRIPLAVNGKIHFAIFNPNVHKTPYYKTSKIKQIQIEQDSGKSYHTVAHKESFIDLNRAGIALIEIVFEPDLDDGEEAASVIKELIAILKRVGSCTCKMEEGALRVDANVSISNKQNELGVRTEIKNIGSVRGVVNAINYEISRQINIVENGGSVSFETLAWDSASEKTVIMREKEGIQDYRFMPEPNLPPLRVIIDEDDEQIHKHVKNKNCVLDLRYLKNRIPRLPHEERKLILEHFKANDLIAFNMVSNPILHKYFIDIMSEDPSRNVSVVYNVLMVPLLTSLNLLNMELRDCKIPYSYLGELVDMHISQSISPGIKESVVLEMLKGNTASPQEIVKEKNWMRASEEQIKLICQEVIDDNPKALEDYLRGKKKVLNYFTNRIMKKCNSTAFYKDVVKVAIELLEAKRK